VQVSKVRHGGCKGTFTADAGIQRRKSGTVGRSYEHKLSERGFDLYPVLVALMQWGEKWAPNGRGLRVELVEKASGEPIRGSVVVSKDGRPLTPWDVRVVAGPGADEKSTGSINGVVLL